MKLNEILKNRKILKKLIKAKEIYSSKVISIDNKPIILCDMSWYGLCNALIEAGFKFIDNLEVVDLPEYNPNFLDAYDYKVYSPYWWNLRDTKSRIKAMDKLINLYRKKSRLRNIFTKSSVF